MSETKEVEDREQVDSNDSRSVNCESQFKGEINFGSIGRRTSESVESEDEESSGSTEKQLEERIEEVAQTSLGNSSNTL